MIIISLFPSFSTFSSRSGLCVEKTLIGYDERRNVIKFVIGTIGTVLEDEKPF